MKRRDFLTNSLLVGAAIPFGAAPGFLTSCSDNDKEDSSKSYSAEDLGMYSFVDIAPDGKPIKAALIGCGDRGTGAAVNFLESGPNISIVALADVFPDRMEGCRKVLTEKFDNNVDDNNCFLGFEAYKKILSMPDIDIVLLCTPTHFRPVQFKAAVEAGTQLIPPEYAQ